MLSSTKSRKAGKSFLQTLFFILLVTQICFAQWTPVVLNEESIKDVAVYNNLIFTVNSDSGKLYRSTDNGISWSTMIERGVIDIDISLSGDVFMVKDSIYNTGPQQLFRSSDAGSNWLYLNVKEQLADPHIFGGPYNIKVNSMGTIFCSFYLVGRNSSHTTIAMSTNNGSLWSCTYITGGDTYDFSGNSVLTFGSYCEPTTCWESIKLSGDGGFQWFNLIDTSMACTTLNLCLNGNILLGGLFGGQIPKSGIFLSSDSCNTWTQVNTLIPQTGLSIESGGTLLGTDSLGVFLFNDDGDSLGSRNDGLTNLNIHSLTVDNNDYVYAGTDNGVWRRPLSEIVTSVKEEVFYEIPTEYFLSQNYPNPFNPSTKIKYSIPFVETHSDASLLMTLKVFDILGNEIETLVNEDKPAGTYEVTWHAANLSSGIYFYQLKAGDYMSVKKMILLK